MFSFALGNIPVRVHMQFLFLAAFIMMSSGDTRLVLSGIVIVFVSVLIHELGHALMGKAFGLSPQIELHGMGGTTSWAHKNVSSGAKILISLAGPTTGIVIGLILKYGGFFDGSRSALVHGVVGQIIFVNLGWGVLNLLPMLPLDGGNVMHQFFAVVTSGDGERPARIVSIVVGVLAAVAALIWMSPFTALLVVMLVVQNVRALRPAEPSAPPPPHQQARW